MFTKYIKNNDIESIKRWINEGANVNNANASGCKPLILAAAENKLEIMELLLRNNANANDVDIAGNTALGCAIICNSMESMNLLIQYGANVNLNHIGKHPLIHSSMINDAKSLQILIKNGARINSTDSNSRTALFHAAWRNRSDLVKILIENGADINIIDDNNNTAFEYCDSIDLKELVFNNRDVDYGSSIKRYMLKRTLLSDNVKSLKKSFIISQYIDDISTEDKNLLQRKGATILHATELFNNKEFISAIMKGIISLRNKIWELFFRTVAYSYLKQAKVIKHENDIFNILLKEEISFNIPHEYIHILPTAFIKNNHNGNFESVKALIKHGANANKTALFYAIDNKRSDLIKLLIENDVDINIADINIIDHTKSKHHKAIKFEGLLFCINNIYNTYPSQLITLISNNVISLKRSFIIYQNMSNEHKNILEAKGGNILSYQELFESHMFISAVKNGEINIKGKVGSSLLINASYHSVNSKDHQNFYHFLTEHGAKANHQHSNINLIYAIQNHNFNLDAFIYDGCDANEIDSDGNSVLFHAARIGNYEAVQKLLHHGVDIHLTNRRGENILDYISEHSNRINLKIIKLFLELKINSNCNKITILKNCIKHNHMGFMRLLIEHGADINRISLMIHAISIGNMEAMKILIENGYDINNTCDNGNSALFYAACENNYDAVKKLLYYGANIHLTNRCDENILHHIIGKNIINLKMVKFFLDLQVDVNAPTKSNHTILRYCIIYDHIDLMNLLIENGANMNLKYGRQSLLFHALSQHNIEAMQVLMDHGYDINELDEHGRTALFYSPNEPDYLNFLIKNAIDINMKDNYNQTAFEYFNSSNHLGKYAEIKLENSLIIINKPEEMHKTTLNEAVKSLKNTIVVSNYTISDSDKNALIEKGAYVGWKEFAFAVKNNKIDISAKNTWVAFCLASAINNEFVINALISAGFDINYQSKFSGLNALMSVAKHSYVPMMELLINNGANINAISKDNKTAFEYLPIEINLKNLNFSDVRNNLLNRTLLHPMVKFTFCIITDANISNGKKNDLRKKNIFIGKEEFLASFRNSIEWQITWVNWTKKNSYGSCWLDFIHAHVPQEQITLFKEHGADLAYKDEFIHAFNNFIREKLNQYHHYVIISEKLGIMSEKLHNIALSKLQAEKNIFDLTITANSIKLRQIYFTLSEYQKNILHKSVKEHLQTLRILYDNIPIFKAYLHVKIIAKHLIFKEIHNDFTSKEEDSLIEIMHYNFLNNIPLTKNKTKINWGRIFCPTQLENLFLSDSSQLILVRNKAQKMEHIMQLHDSDNLDQALIWASIYGFTNAIEQLIKFGANIDYATEKGSRTPLMLAVMKNHINVVEKLIKLKANVNAQDESGMTALSHACNRGHIEIIKLLIKPNTDIINTIIQDNMTILELCLMNRRIEVVNLLISHGVNLNNFHNDMNIFQYLITDGLKIENRWIIIKNASQIDIKKLKSCNLDLNGSIIINNELSLDAMNILKDKGAIVTKKDFLEKFKEMSPSDNHWEEFCKASKELKLKAGNLIIKSKKEPMQHI